MGERSRARKRGKNDASKQRRRASALRRPRQLGLAQAYRGRGGPRPGAGRKPGPGRRRVPHRRRGAVRRDRPLHVTLRLRSGLPRLRRRDEFGRITAAIRGAHKADFRIVHDSVLENHVHLVVEADHRRALSRGM